MKAANREETDDATRSPSTVSPVPSAMDTLAADDKDDSLSDGQAIPSAHNWPRTPRADVTPQAAACAMQAEWVLAILICTCVVSAWRGAWLVLDALFFTHNPALGAGITLSLGVAVFLLLNLIQPWLGFAARRKATRVTWLLDLIFSYAGLWCCVLVWRGVWQLWDHALGVGFPPGPPDAILAWTGWISHISGCILLVPLDGVRAMNAPPMIWVNDSAYPLYGARTTPGVHGISLFLKRLANPPPMPHQKEWRASVGLPTIKRGYGGMPMPTMSPGGSKHGGDQFVPTPLISETGKVSATSAGSTLSEESFKTGFKPKSKAKRATQNISVALEEAALPAASAQAL